MVGVTPVSSAREHGEGIRHSGEGERGPESNEEVTWPPLLFSGGLRT